MQPVRTRKSKGGSETCRVMTWHDSYNSEPTILIYQPTLADANDGSFQWEEPTKNLPEVSL